MKADNERLIQLLKNTSEYQDLDDTDILKKAKYLQGQGAGPVCDTFGIETNKAKSRKKKDADANEWIPTEAVRKIKEI